MLLLSLILLSLFPATPELAIHSTVLVRSSQSVCILTTSPLTYALYVTFKLSLRHILPAILILLRPRIAVAKRDQVIILINITIIRLSDQAELPELLCGQGLLLILLSPQADHQD